MTNVQSCCASSMMWGPGPRYISLIDGGEVYVSSRSADSQVRHSGPEGALLGFVGDGLSGQRGTATGQSSGALCVADTANGVIRPFERSDDITRHDPKENR